MISSAACDGCNDSPVMRCFPHLTAAGRGAISRKRTACTDGTRCEKVDACSRSRYTSPLATGTTTGGYNGRHTKIAERWWGGGGGATLAGAASGRARSRSACVHART